MEKTIEDLQMLLAGERNSQKKVEKETAESSIPL
jgi:hypothetical protein